MKLLLDDHENEAVDAADTIVPNSSMESSSSESISLSSIDSGGWYYCDYLCFSSVEIHLVCIDFPIHGRVMLLLSPLCFNSIEIYLICIGFVLH